MNKLNWSTEVMSFMKLLDYFQIPTERILRFPEKKENGVKTEALYQQITKKAETREDFELIFKREFDKRQIPRIAKAKIEISKIENLVEKCGEEIRQSNKKEDEEFFYQIDQYIKYLNGVIGANKDQGLTKEQIEAIYKSGNDKYWYKEDEKYFSSRFDPSINYDDKETKQKLRTVKNQRGLAALLYVIKEKYEISDYEECFASPRFGIKSLSAVRHKTKTEEWEELFSMWEKIINL